VFTHKYLCDLVEIASITMKLLEKAAEGGEEEDSDEKGKKKKKKKEVQKDTILRMKAAAHSFDIGHYFHRLVTNSVIRMYASEAILERTILANITLFLSIFIFRSAQVRAAASRVQDQRGERAKRASLLEDERQLN